MSVDKGFYSRVMRDQGENLAAPFIQNDGPATKPLWVSKARQYGILARKSGLSFSNDYCVGFYNTVGSIIIALDFILKPDTILGCCSTVIFTLLYWKYGQHLSVNMSWNVISFGIIFPITRAIGMGFSRREQALKDFASLAGHLRHLFGAVHTWKVKTNDGWVKVIEELGTDTKATKEEIRLLFDEFLTSLITYFTCKRWKHARHVMSMFLREQDELEDIAHEQRLCIDASLARIQRLVQDLKAHGLPGGEAHRLDQYVSKISVNIETLSALKEFRTPRAFGAFARIYIQILGALYGPYYLTIAHGSNKDEANIAFAIIFAISIQLTMSGLYYVMLGLEDPFAKSDTDAASSASLDNPTVSSSSLSPTSKLKGGGGGNSSLNKRMSIDTSRVPDFVEMTGGKGTSELDSVSVPQIVEMTRRMMIQAEEEASSDWRTSMHFARSLRTDSDDEFPDYDT